MSCPRPALPWDTKTLSMANRIAQRKLNFVCHIKNLNDEDLAKQVFDEQLVNGYPGIDKEVQELCENLGIPEVTKDRKDEKSKAKWKKIIEEAVEKKNEVELKEKIRKYEKLEIMKQEDYGQKNYLEQLTLLQARTLFRVRTRMVNCKMNQLGDRKNKASLWKCGECGYIDSQLHIIHCPAYQNLREGKDLNSDVDIANYFKEVLKIREGI